MQTHGQQISFFANQLPDTSKDQTQLQSITARIAQLRKEITGRLLLRGQDRAGKLQQSVERDVEMAGLQQRLRHLDHMGPYACLGFMQYDDTGERTYVGRAGLSDSEGNQLMLDWRAPAAKPFFAATHEHPLGLSMRRRYRWRRQLVSDYWDEVFDATLINAQTRLDDHSSFIASLGSARSAKMQDVLSTIQADQDAIIRASSQGALVVDGGPGTGKTVVALHRAAYLLYADPRLRAAGGRVLVVSPHEAYSAYVSDVLPNLGEEEVLVSTLSNIVSIPDISAEPDAHISRIKSSMAMVHAVERAVKVFEEPPSHTLRLALEEDEAFISPETWHAATELIDHSAPHNEVRNQLREALADLLLPQVVQHGSGHESLRLELLVHPALASYLDEYWPLLEPAGLLRALYSIPALLRYAGDELSNLDIDRLLSADTNDLWTDPDIPLLYLARTLLGAVDAEAKELHSAAQVEAERLGWKTYLDGLIASADDFSDLTSQLVHADLQEQLVAQGMEAQHPARSLEGPFSHVIIDEAQELTDAQWAMIQRLCPSGSMTIVGDRAQAAHGFTLSWEERLQHVGIHDVTLSRLTVNYRSTAQIMEVAAQEIHPALPDANVPVSIRDGLEVRYAKLADLDSVLQDWLAQNSEGVVAVIGHPNFDSTTRVRSLSPENAKGLEFDLVIIYQPENYGRGVQGTVRRYVAMTRATAELVILTGN